MLERRVEGAGQRRQEGRLAGAVDAQQGDAVTGRDGEPVDGQKLALAAGCRDVQPGDAQRHLGVDVAVAELEPPLARHVGLRALLLDPRDARLDRVLALVEVGILDRPDLVARRGLLQPADLLVLQPCPHRGGGVAAQQLLARVAEAGLEGMHAVAAQEQRALGRAVQKLPVVAHDQHRHRELDGEPALQGVDVGEVEMVGRLVEDQDIGLFQPRRRRDQQQPLPAARQRAERLVQDLRLDADLVQQHVDAPVVVAQPDLDQGVVQDVAHRPIGQARRHVLRHAADPESARADHLAAIQLELAGEALQQGRLAGAVLADQRRPRAVEQERHAAEDAGRAVEEGGPLHPEHGLTRRHCRSPKFRGPVRHPWRQCDRL